ncbi:MipA/OmpV family protein [Gilvimarinus algae]|uniref:MipA/OmpV family protein n=1 Tax=Gilvimarinus algae TaxID=3058037 RepID=A0ABT8T9Z5_9GAMM|nr:MipA/OmpV family protein [Gilvimarinus sp. SDUM040014]MDO3380766.1 MipA/OmpV family protein [Gilvimarinus sp. SDUM040014]
MRRCLLAMVLAMACTSEAGEWTVEAGAGGAALQTPWKGVDVELTPLPYISARYGRWGFGVGEGLVQYDVLRSPVRLSLGLGYRDETYQSDYALVEYDSDDRVFAGYDSPDGEVTAHVQLDYSIFHLRLVQDIEGQSDGASALLRADIPLYRHGSGWQVSARVGAYWMESVYATEVFGVTGDNVNPALGRYHYTLDDSLNAIAGAQLYIPLGQRHSLRGFARYERLDSAIADSPLVGRAYRAQLGLIFVTRF